MSTSFFRHILTLSLSILLSVVLATPAFISIHNLSSLSPEQQSIQGDNDGLKVLESTEQSLLLDLSVPTFDLIKNASDQGPCNQIEIPGWDTIGKEGEPAVPFNGVMVALPPGTNPKITIIGSEPEKTINKFTLCPVPTSLGKILPNGGVQSVVEKLILNQNAYASEKNYPDSLAKFGETGYIRSQLVAQLRLQPFRYNAITQTLTYYSHLRVKVDFGSQNMRLSSSSIDEGEFETIFQNLLINYQEAKSWRENAVQSTSTSTSQSTQPSYKLAVAQDGLVMVTHLDLQTAGLPVDSIDPRTFRLTNQGQDVAILVAGEADGVFNNEDKIIFYGEKVISKFTDTNIYWLTWGEINDPLRVMSVIGTPAGGSIPSSFRANVHREENKAYMGILSSGPNQDHWFWEMVNTGVPVTKSYTLNLTNVSSDPATARIKGLITGFAANPQHHTHIYINDHLISESFWPAKDDLSFDIEFPQDYLFEGTNTIKVECPMTDGVLQEAIYINWFEIEYAKNYQADGIQTNFTGDNSGDWEYQLIGFPDDDLLLWDITDPFQPIQITNPSINLVGSSYTLSFEHNILEKHKYLTIAQEDLSVPSSIVLSSDVDLQNSFNSADYIIISHPDFLSAIQPLAEYHIANGLRVKIVNVMDIYDQFNYGIFNPDAIRDFVDYAYTNWTKPAPSYILLVGDGNYDFLNYLGKNQTNFIPPYLAYVDPWLGQVPADNRYVDIRGSDLLPDLAIGRFPVNTEIETTNIVNKVLAYKSSTEGDWADQAAFIAGKNDPSSGDFPGLSDGIINAILNPHSVAVEKIYYQTTYPDTVTTRQGILNAFNQGKGVIHYSGHSTSLGWYGDGDDPNNSNVFISSDVASLTNSEHLPFVVSMTCLIGNFNNPYIKVLDETLLITPEVGSIASWSPTGKGLTSGHDLLDQGLFKAIYENKVTDLGRATNLAKYYLFANSTGSRDLLDTFVLLGDPALNLPIDMTVYLPLIIR